MNVDGSFRLFLRVLEQLEALIQTVEVCKCLLHGQIGLGSLERWDFSVVVRSNSQRDDGETEACARQP